MPAFNAGFSATHQIQSIIPYNSDDTMMSTEAALPSTAPSATDISKEINATTTTATKDNDVVSSIDHSATMTTTKNDDAQDMRKQLI